ncbi:MAG: acyl-CoA synthetase FdrA, partial [Caldilineaceae bacterium]|nr:acyl-CoA synthetase FdrA [Caldilineaceae bacterium]
DSIVLMQLQRGLAALPGVTEAGVVMGTPANKDVLAQSGLLSEAAQHAGADDLIIVVQGEGAAAALAQVDALLAKRARADDSDYRPHSLDAAATLLPAAQWVLISVPGRYAAGVAREALRLDKHVFLYSDNVPLEEEVALKQQAAAQGLLVMGPDCGTAIVAGVGLGFANQVRRGPIGLIGASGTGLQLATARIHQLGSGVSQALGTGGRDLSDAVGGATARQALDLLAHDPATRVIVLISKPPSPAVAADILRTARAAGKPVVIDFIGYTPDRVVHNDLYFAETLDQAAELAVELATLEDEAQDDAAALHRYAPGQRYLRGLFSGGTLAYEAQLLLTDYLPAIYANAPLDKRFALEKATVSREHTIVDLGEDEFTVGRLHPMMDHELRIKRLLQEAADPATAVILLDVVLGYGAHPDPAAELAPAIAQARALAAQQGRYLTVVAVVVGTDADPQPLDAQGEQLRAAGAHVVLSNEAAVRYAGAELQRLNRIAGQPPVAATALAGPLAAINVGLETFTESLLSQGAAVVHVAWRPPAGGNEKLAGILARLKKGTRES